MKLKIVLVLFGLGWASAASAHPHDDPLVFRKHLTDDGQVIYSNIPKACFSQGLLTCDHLHPIYGMPIAPKGSKSKSKQKSSVSRSTSSTTNTISSIGCSSKKTCSEMSSCNEVDLYVAQCGFDWDGDGDGIHCDRKCE